MCNYSAEDIKQALQHSYDILHPVYLFCNPKHYEYLKKELDETIYDVVSSPIVEENKIHIINKADLELPFENSDIPRIDLSFLDELINKGGEE